jgi:osmotically inducible lipoprotein OsmB
MSKSKFSLIFLLAVTLISVAGCAGYNTQLGAATGAGAGALIGYGIGGDTESTLIGAALGGTAGAVIGNGIDTYNSRNGYYNYYSPTGPKTGNYYRPVSGPRRR